MWIVKLGGSLARGATLGAWLRAIADIGAGKIVVVPGGGIYADAVREQQRQWGFVDSAAHSMALLAMDQFGLQLAALGNSGEPHAFVVAHEKEELRNVLRSLSIPVWLPSRWADREPSIARHWEMTSDSLALWLAKELRAAGIVLVKSAMIVPGEMRAEQAVNRAWVDAEFPGLLRKWGGEAWLLGPDRTKELARLVARQTPVGLRLT